MAANNDVKENEITQASAQATLANLKEIRVVTTDGSSKAYGKADFMAVIAAGIKSYFSSIAAGNIAGILTADSGKAGISALADVAQVLGVKQSSYLTQGESAPFIRGSVVCLSKTTKNLLVLVKAGTTEPDTVIMNFGTNTTDVSVSWNNNETVITNNASGNLSYVSLL